MLPCTSASAGVYGHAQLMAPTLLGDPTTHQTTTAARRRAGGCQSEPPSPHHCPRTAHRMAVPVPVRPTSHSTLLPAHRCPARLLPKKYRGVLGVETQVEVGRNRDSGGCSYNLARHHAHTHTHYTYTLTGTGAPPLLDTCSPLCFELLFHTYIHTYTYIYTHTKKTEVIHRQESNKL